MEGTIAELNEKLSKVVAELSTKQETADNYHRVSFVANLNKQITEKERTIKQLHTTIEKLKSHNTTMDVRLSRLQMQISSQPTPIDQACAATQTNQDECANTIEQPTVDTKNIIITTVHPTLDTKKYNPTKEPAAAEATHEPTTVESVTVGLNEDPTEEPTAAPNEKPTAEPNEKPTAEPNDEFNEKPTTGLNGEPTDDPDEDYTTETFNGKDYLCHKETSKVYLEEGDYLIHVGRITSKGELKLKKKKASI